MTLIGISHIISANINSGCLAVSVVEGGDRLFELRFDKTHCMACNTGSCLVKCQYIDVEKNTAVAEMLKMAAGQDSFVLEDCVTCYACEEYCEMGNHPFYLIVEKQEEMDKPPMPKPLIRRGVQMGIPFRGEPDVTEVDGKAIDMCVFSPFSDMMQGKLFQGIPIISTDPRKMYHFFCQLMYLHYARSSVIKERLPGVIERIARHNVTELICFHDECYGTFASYCPAVGIEVPFKPVHLFEHLYNRLLELKDEIKPLGIKAAYQRPCSARLSPDKDHLVDEIFRLIGVQSVEREYVGENSVCCAGLIMGQRRIGSRKLAAELQRKNIDDMATSGAEVCVFNCPGCFDSLSDIVTDKGMRPIFMSDLCRLAIGEKPAARR